MKRIKCIDNKGCKASLTFGKFYDVYEASSESLHIKDDRRMMVWYSRDKFETFGEEFDEEKIEEYSLIEILDKKFLGKKFKRIGEQEIYEVYECRGDYFLRTFEQWRHTISASKEALNAKYTMLETFGVGEIVQNKKTGRFYKIAKVYGTTVSCVNSGITTINFSVDEIKRVPITTLRDLEAIFKEEKIRIPF